MPPETSKNTSPEAPETTQGQIAALLGHAGVYPIQHGWIRVTGDDRLRWLSGMLTNGIQQLEPNTGNYNFVLNAQGRIQGDCYAYARLADVLLITSADQLTPLMALLDRFIIMDDVEITDVSAEWHGIDIVGPQAQAILDKIDIPAGGMEPSSLRQLCRNGFDLTLFHTYSPTVPRYAVWCSSANESAAIRSALIAAGAVDCEPEAVEDFRILNGIPRYGTDIRDKDLPQETAQTRALHFNKGCYIGQEIVERIRSRGAVHRTFSGFLIEGELPAAGTVLELDGKPVGEITSAAVIPLKHGEKKIALGYIRREALLQKNKLSYAGGTAMATDLPVAVEAL